MPPSVLNSMTVWGIAHHSYVMGKIGYMLSLAVTGGDRLSLAVTGGDRLSLAVTGADLR